MISAILDKGREWRRCATMGAMRSFRRGFGALAAALTLVLVAGACTTPAGGPGTEQPPAAEPPTVTIVAPVDGAVDVSTAVEIRYTVEGTDTPAQVTLTDANGSVVGGAPHPDGSAWLPGKQLNYGAQYTLTVVATTPEGLSAQATSTFTTMATPLQTVRVSSFNGDNVTYGVGMPIIINFETPVPEHQRDEIERRLFVTSNPPQEGSWHWISSYYHTAGSQIRYRPKEFWQPGTTVHARIALGGVSWGYQGIYGRNDLTLDFRIGDSQIMEVEDLPNNKQMTFTRNGEVIRTIPVSLGRPNPAEFRSSEGTMLIMRQEHPRVFDTRRERGDGGWYTEVEYAMQLTTSGEFIHDAPWSVGSQGHTNVSHGCINVSPENALWLYQETQVGDPVIVKGTGKPLVWGDGFTDWNIPYSEWVKGSALPTTPVAPNATPSA